MKPADKFNPGQWLVENKLTKQSQLNELFIKDPEELTKNIVKHYWSKVNNELGLNFNDDIYSYVDSYDEPWQGELANKVINMEFLGYEDFKSQVQEFYDELTNQSPLGEMIVMDPNRKVNFESIEIDDVDDNDYPDFSNAYVSYAEYADGTPLTNAELEKFENENYGIAQEIALENY